MAPVIFLFISIASSYTVVRVSGVALELDGNCHGGSGAMARLSELVRTIDGLRSHMTGTEC